MDDTLYHHGVKGMKWGVKKDKRTDSNGRTKKHLGIDDKGNISIISGKTTTTGKKKFAIKTSLFIGTMALSTYIAKHPSIIVNGKKAADKVLNKTKDDMVDNLFTEGYVYSERLGKMINIKDAMTSGS